MELNLIFIVQHTGVHQLFHVIMALVKKGAVFKGQAQNLKTTLE